MQIPKNLNCLEDYQTDSSKYITVVTCRDVRPDNGQARYSASPLTNGGYPVDTVIYWTCNYGYSLSGLNATFCETSGQWHLPTPTCNKSNENKMLIY